MIKSKFASLIENAVREKGVNIPEEKKSKFSSYATEVEREFDSNIESAVERLKDKIGDINSEFNLGIEGRKDSIVKQALTNISKD